MCAWGLALSNNIGSASAMSTAVAPGHQQSGELSNKYRLLRGFYPVENQESVHFIACAPASKGSYDAVLMLHGYRRSDRHWGYHQIALAIEDWVSVAIDYDETAPEQDQLLQIRTAIERMRAHPEVQSVSICGTSWGGKMALETIAKMPELDIATAFIVYPTLPFVTDQQVANIRTDILNCVGAVDPLSPISYMIEEKVRECNDQIAYKLHVYSRDDFPQDADHGFLFARTPEEFNDVARDSFVRWLSLVEWKLGKTGPPPWISDPKILREEHLLKLTDR
ncbi:MAG: hypothetical protein CME06_00790 [Gemmatimonadetes bacterium]|nr:hypothetical protein [Gemmatimonadota bacterium]